MPSAKQKEIDHLNYMLRLCEEHNKMLQDKVNAMIKAKDDDFSHSTVYMEMKRELLLADTLKDREGALKRQIFANAKMLDEMKKLRDDNRDLCREHDVDYWPGITSFNGWDMRDAQRAEQRIMELEAALAAKDKIIEHLKTIIAGEDPTPTPANPVGSPKKIDEETKKRARRLRREGWTLQQIAESEGISKGSVCAICKGIKKKTAEN